MAEDRQQPQDVLQEEILADARRQAERALQRARKEARGIAEAAAAELEAWRTGQLDLAQTEAKHHSDLVLAGLPVETGRMRANRIEALLQSIRDEALKRLDSREGPGYCQALVNLAAEAIRNMAGTRFSITVSEVDRSLLGEGEVKKIRQLAGRPDLELEVIGDSKSRDAGLVVQGGDREEYWDNRFSKRLERQWPTLRREIALRTALLEPHESKKGDAP